MYLAHLTGNVPVMTLIGDVKLSPTQHDHRCCYSYNTLDSSLITLIVNNHHHRNKYTINSNQTIMRHFSLMKLLTVSSFSTSSSDCLSTHQRGSSSSRLTSRGLQLKKTLIDASTIECNEVASTNDVVSSRRQALHSMMGFSAGLAFVSGNAKVSTALDMDAFMNSQLDADTKNCDPKVDSKCIPKLSSDEAMCKYGQSGDARGEACRRVKEAGGKLPTSAGPAVKSLGGAYAM